MAPFPGNPPGWRGIGCEKIPRSFQSDESCPRILLQLLDLLVSALKLGLVGVTKTDACL